MFNPRGVRKSSWVRCSGQRRGWSTRVPETLTGESEQRRCPLAWDCAWVPLLLYSFTPLLLYSFTPLLLCSFTPLLLYSFTPLVLYSFTPLLLNSFSPLVLYSFTPLLLYSFTPYATCPPSQQTHLLHDRLPVSLDPTHRIEGFLSVTDSHEDPNFATPLC